MENNWTSLLRQYLARRDPALLEQAIAVAQDEKVGSISSLEEGASPAALLTAFQQRDIATVDRLSESLHESLQNAGQVEEALTVALLPADLRAQLVEFYNEFPFEQQMQALQMGLEACDTAILFATLLDDPPCVAVYQVAKGNGLYRARDLEAARAAYEEALQTYRRLAQAQPGVYLPDVAMTLNNLGTVLRDLREMEAARAAYEKAIALRERCGLYLDSAETHYNLGLLEEDEGNTERALTSFERCVERCDHGLSQLAEREHRDLFQSKIEPAYERLIEHYASLAASNGVVRMRGSEGGAAPSSKQDTPPSHAAISSMEEGGSPAEILRSAQNDKDLARERLVGLLESLRRVEALAGFGEAAADQSVAAYQKPFHDLMSGRGQLSDLFRQRRCAFLWVHAARDGVVFVILTPQDCRVKVAGRELLEKFWELFEEAKRGMTLLRVNPSRLNEAALEEALQLTAQILEAAHARRLKEAREALARLQSAGEAVFNLLPDEVKTLLAGNEYETVFLAPCRATMNLPFEMIRTTEEWENSTRSLAPCGRQEWRYLGLRRVMPRAHGLAELAQVVERQPDLNGEKTALVVGNPLHDGAASLRHAEARAVALANELKRRGYRLVGGTGRAGRDAPPLLQHDATEEAVLNGLAQKPILWVHNGHGDLLSLLLSGSDQLTSHTVVQQQWEHHPVVHNDCCHSGATLGRGGGRFDGHPTAALIAGAACVLSSVHALWDDTAKEFSERLYGKALDAEKPLPLADALLQTRREMAGAHHDNPLVWATTVLWGNPWARLA